jgi:hypothetical protein
VSSTNAGYAKTLLLWAGELTRTGRNLKELGEYGMNSSGLQQNLVLGSCEHGNETTGSIKVRKFLEHLRDLKILLKDGYAPWCWSVSNTVMIFPFLCWDEEEADIVSKESKTLK